jgi:transcriptional regulator GlxA family with amidase domain
MGAHDAKYNINEAEIKFIKKAYEECFAFLTICGGFVAPLQAGLLKGKTATGPRILLEMLRKSNPEVDWVEKRWVRDGKLWSSGALLNGNDMVAAFMRETYNSDPEGIVEFGLRLGAWPHRHLDYADVPWVL